MTDKIVVLVTSGNMREAKKIGRHLVESGLAACVNISPAIRSIYRWKGSLNDDHEFLLLIKTRRDLFRKIKDAVLELHSYDTPEIISIPIADGSESYLAWIDGSVKRNAKVAANR